ncbi:MAG: IS1595 family transposase [Clostridia bacterium]|nr:IS1595 family transposase [Clostridia bacterium]
MNQLDNILTQVESLDKNALELVAHKLYQLLKGSDDSCNHNDPVHKCRKCGSEHIMKYGKDSTGKQRYRCKSCGATFFETSGSVVSGSHCSDDKWEKYIELLINGASLCRCAEECHISVQTAFLWRHKILHALQADQNNRVLAGIIEVDDTYISISYKGNHSKSKKFTMPRAPYKRGSDNRSATGSKACVMCAVERNGQLYSEVMGKGQLTTKRVEYAFKDRIMPESIVLADNSWSIGKFFKANDTIGLVQLKSTVNPKNKRGGTPEIIGTYHIQTVNNLHKRLRIFLQRYNGVSTKYLNHYINLFVWIDNHKKLADTLGNEMKSYIAGENTYIRNKDIIAMPVIPQAA